ncbi:MAG TPA: PKD domain-containing protein [Methanosarcina sp.]|jgi:PKD repeat protein
MALAVTLENPSITINITRIKPNGGQHNPDIYGDRIVGANCKMEKTIHMGVLVNSDLSIAAFPASSISGKALLTVSFTDKSSGMPTSWKWNFGDGAPSTEKNPKH